MDISLRKLVIDYLGGECSQCGSTERLCIHHTIPISAGGQNSMGNIEPVCVHCHRKLHAQLYKLYPVGGKYRGFEKEATEKVAAAKAMMELVELGIISRDTVPDELLLTINRA